MAAGDDPGELLVLQRGAQRALQRVLFDVHRRLVRCQIDSFDELGPPLGPPGAPAQPGKRRKLGYGIRAQHACAGRAGRRAAVGRVQDDGGYGVPGEGKGKCESGRPGAYHDHRVHSGETSQPWWC
ncbi:hypothetical protein GCM10009863_44970 [Streptomyces axinellae]|uniref:Transposase n=1 Tax=Streptomyces axinellae TaxID=552788 RepID=A0ABN3QFR3_9ACTN